MTLPKKNDNTNKLIIFFCIIELLNIIFAESSLNLIVTLPQILYVLVLILRGKLEQACYCNIIFTVLCFNSDFALDADANLLSFAKIKLFGPITLSYALAGIIWLLTLKKYPKISSENMLFYKFYKILKYLLYSGSAIGVLGIIIFSYPLAYFIKPFVYIVVALVYSDILLRTCNEEMLKKYHHTSLCLLVASPISTTISFFIFKVRTTYSIFDALITNEIYMYVPVLIVILLFDTKYKTQIIIALTCYFINLVAAARGAYYMTTAIALVMCVYLIYFSNTIQSFKIRFMVKYIIPVIAAFASIYIAEHISGDGLTSHKFSQFLSLANLFFQSGGSFDFSPDSIASSPYIRIGEFVDIVYEASYNPIGFIFGKGYGGGYIDDLGLFTTLDLTQGAFSEDIVKLGVFRSAHSMLPSTLLYNGLLGTIMLIYIGISYIKKITVSPYVFIAITLFFYNFYYNPLLIIVSVFILFGAEYDFNLKAHKY